MADKRQPNFSPTEVLQLFELVTEEHTLNIIQQESSDVEINKRKARVWESVTQQLNVVTGLQRQSKAVREKWSQLVSQAKKAQVAYTKYSNGTGGGPPPQQIPVVIEKIRNLYEKSVRFTGIIPEPLMRGGRVGAIPTIVQGTLTGRYHAHSFMSYHL